MDKGLYGMSWSPCLFDVNAKINEVHLGESDTIDGFCSTVIDEPLNPSLPLWNVYLLQREGFSTLLFRFHHALGDAKSLEKDIEQMFSDQTSPASKRPSTSFKKISHVTQFFYYLYVLIKLSFVFFIAMFAPLPSTETRALFHFNLGFVSPMIKSTRALKGTLNDIFLASVSKAVQMYDQMYNQGRSKTKQVVVISDLRNFEEIESSDSRRNLSFPVHVSLSSEPNGSHFSEMKSRMDFVKASKEVCLTDMIQNAMFSVLPQMVSIFMFQQINASSFLLTTNYKSSWSTRRTLASNVPLHVEESWYCIPSSTVGGSVAFSSFNGMAHLAITLNTEQVKYPDVLANFLKKEFLKLVSKKCP